MKYILLFLLTAISLTSFGQGYVEVNYRLGYNQFRNINPSFKYEVGYTHKYYSFGVAMGKAKLSQVTWPLIDRDIYIEPKICINSNPGKLAFIAYGGYQIYSKLPVKQGMITLGLGASVPITNKITTYLMISKADMNEYLSFGIHYSFKKIKTELEFLK